MSFISVEFLVLVLVTLALYYIPQLRRDQVAILVVASLTFYGWDQWRLLPLLLAAVAMTYLSMLGGIRGSKGAVAGGIVANLLILAFFKYKFLVLGDSASVNTGNELADFLLGLPLPIGISFFVFHNISLIVDFHKSGRGREAPSAMQVLLYILFFPQLISGPITRAAAFMPQTVPKLLRDVPWIQVVELLITGLFFKLFCANNLAQITAQMVPQLWSNTGGGDKLILLFAYSMQIYADFFGYSTIALGLALVFGYRLPINFRLPYIAASFSEFWSRWHISLSLWLRQYLYIPLGGNRKSLQRTYFNLLTVMTLGGLWHGASASYAIWGLAHGMLLVLERFAATILGTHFPNRCFGAVSRVVYALFVFVCVSLCWLLFRFQEFTHASGYLMAILGDPFLFSQDKSWYRFTLVYMSPVIIQHIVAGRGAFGSAKLPLRAIFWGCMLWLAFVERGADTPFIYFRF